MKKFKSLLILTFCFTILLSTTITIYDEYSIAPCNHFEEDADTY